MLAVLPSPSTTVRVCFPAAGISSSVLGHSGPASIPESVHTAAQTAFPCTESAIFVLRKVLALHKKVIGRHDGVYDASIFILDDSIGCYQNCLDAFFCLRDCTERIPSSREILLVLFRKRIIILIKSHLAKADAQVAFVNEKINLSSFYSIFGILPALP